MSANALMCAVFACLPYANAPQESQETRKRFDPSFHREQPNDPPAQVEPDRAAGGGPRSIFTRGPWRSIQVNVNASHANIVGDAANEPSIAVDPTNPNRMVIGWRQFDSISSDFREAGRAYSTNRGETWTFPGVLENGVFRSDPVLRADATGKFYYNSLKSNFLCDVFVSTDGGVTWPSKFAAFGGDKQWMAIDTSGSVGQGFIYESWSTAAGCCGSNIFSRSTNGAVSWLTPIGLPSSPVWGTPSVGPDGELYIPGVDSPPLFPVVKSTNAKNGGTPSFSLVAQVDLGGDIVFGETPNPEGLMGQVWLDVDRSDGPSHGYVYLLCTIDRPGSDPADIMIARSTNGGTSWSAPLRINESSGNTWQWFGTLGVAPNGRLDVVWLDTRASPSNSRFCELYYAYSLDRAVTWSKNLVASPQFNSTVGWPQQMKMGDYYDIASENAAANVAYAATHNGEQDVYYIRLGDCDDNGVHDGEEIASGAGTDFNHNGILDRCDGLGDMNCDGSINGFDIDEFVAALTDPGSYTGCDITRGDINGDGSINGFDIDQFVAILGG
ncbi:MAG: hypothetical protein CHACPFDD_00123 [Phycisphaerae bacterium]|nr:hypothetical protein [Phycisphaerae bacterium]